MLGREQVPAEKLSIESLADQSNSGIEIKILCRVTSITAIKKIQPLALFRFHPSDQDFLQMLVRTLIIAEGHFYERAVAQRAGKFGGKLFYILIHLRKG